MIAIKRFFTLRKAIAALAVCLVAAWCLAQSTTIVVDGKIEPLNAILVDTAALVASNTEARLAELGAANLPLDIDALTVTAAAIEAEVEVIETHQHSGSDCFGLAATPAGTTHLADEWGAGAAAAEAAHVVVDAGNDDWGTWTQILGSTDTPHRAAMTQYDFHQILITNTETPSILYGVQLSYTALAPADDPTTAGTFTSFNFVSESAAPTATKPEIDVHGPRVPAGTNAWMRTRATGTNTSTIDFLFCLHEYIL